MVILTEGYKDGAERDWLRALRLKRYAKLGTHQVEPGNRLYITDDTVLLYIPYGVEVFKDEHGRLFIDKNAVKGWDRLKNFLGTMLQENDGEENFGGGQ